MDENKAESTEVTENIPSASEQTEIVEEHSKIEEIATDLQPEVTEETLVVSPEEPVDADYVVQEGEPSDNVQEFDAPTVVEVEQTESIEAPEADTEVDSDVITDPMADSVVDSSGLLETGSGAGVLDQIEVRTVDGNAGIDLDADKKPRKIPLRFSTIIGASEKLKAIFNTISKLADTDSTVLVLGESGVGKELFARAIHFHSPRKNKNFVTVNCGAIPEELLESELFGHEKGSFTGAIRTRVGKFEMAHDGTIFLDEIGDMSPTLQVKLLRILQQQEFERVGSNQVIKTDVRVLAATNQNLEKAIKEKKFREDLYYRLNVIPLKIPPLRERKDDIPALIDAFIRKFNRTKNRAVTGVSPSALAALTEYDWPGNVRELENICERMVVIKGEGRLEVEDLPPQFSDAGAFEEELNADMLLVGALEEDLEPASPKGHITVIPDSGINLKEVVEEYEMSLILQALEKCDWVKNKAAALLGLNRTTLVEKLKKRGITR